MIGTTSIQINPEFVTHEGFDYLVYEGEYFKGCTRCGGTGHYSHNGEHSYCYKCDNGYDKLGDSLPSREAAEKWCHERALRRAAKIRKEEARVAALQAKMEAKRYQVAVADPEVFEFLMSINLGTGYDTEEEYYAAVEAGTYTARDKDAFLRSMAENLVFGIHADRPFTEKMIAASRKAMERRQAKTAEAASHPAPSGRVVVTGEITSTKIVDGDYGTAYKVTVLSDEGYRVYVSLAKSLLDSAAEGLSYDPANGWFHETKGRRLSFTATLEPSRDDVSFAFGSRPTKATWI